MDGTRSTESSEPPEVYEHIPWAELAVPAREKKTWVVYVVAGAILAASLGTLAARSVVRSTASPSLATVPTVPEPVAVTLPPPSTQEEALTEADLLAIAPGQSEISAAARAEWFVTDYFSTGGDPAASRAVLEALPEGSGLPAPTGSVSNSYVAWVATTRIEALGRQRFRSTVLFRVLVSGEDGEYVRLPVRAVDVVVEVDPAGGTRVMDLPMPVEVPAGPVSESWGEAADVPDGVRAAALRRADSWGDEPAFIEGSHREGGWRVVVSVVDGAGVRWPLTLWLTDQGDSAW